jgi:hypothetical protein
MENYICDSCNYQTRILYNFNRHCTTEKHIKNTHKLKDICSYCNKEYRNRKTLWSHEKICKIDNERLINQAKLYVETIVDEKINIIIQTNEENKKLLKEEIHSLNEENTKLLKEEIQSLNTKIDQVKPNVFNLNIFLNEQCKHAMSIDAFLSQLKIQFHLDNKLQHDASVGLTKALTDMDVFIRPFHCLDLKRNKICIKDNDIWTTDPKVFDKVPKHITSLYQEEVNKWEQHHDGFLNNSEQLSIYVLHSAKHMQVMNSIKLLRTVLKATPIPKHES